MARKTVWLKYALAQFSEKKLQQGTFKDSSNYMANRNEPE